jgi:hypothetical protein
MGRRVREWPRLVAAVAVAAVALVLIGVVVASASSGGTKTVSETVSAKRTAVVTSAPKPAASNADKQRIANLQAQLKRQSTELTTARHALSTSIARTHCWRNKANNPAKERSVRCPTGSLTH